MDQAFETTVVVLFKSARYKYNQCEFCRANLEWSLAKMDGAMRDDLNR